MRSLVGFLVLALAGCGSSGGAPPGPPDAGRADAGPPLFPEKPECEGAAIVTGHGDQTMVISKLAIGEVTDGFDLDGDGNPDNKLATLGAVAQMYIDDAFAKFQLVVPLEMFDYPQNAPDDCVKLAFYLANYRLDTDGDGEKTAGAGGDCDDHDPGAHPGAEEIAANGKDDDCNGFADDQIVDGNVIPSEDTTDGDGDGWSLKQGDCDDTDGDIYPGQPEVCGDGWDNDCSGVADEGTDGQGVEVCTPFDDTPDVLPLDPRSFDTGGQPLITFTSGSTATVGGQVQLTAGPSRFALNVPIQTGLSLDLRVTGATIEADVVERPGGLGILHGRLGGVMDAHTLDQVRGLDYSQFGIYPEDSLLDALFANILGTLLGLKKDPATGCRMPDIDVDRDGLEMFCDSLPNDESLTVDTCIDGDGTVYLDEKDAQGTVTKHCTELTNPDGTFKFVDGISLELNFDAVKTLLPPTL